MPYWGPRAHVGSWSFRELGWLQIADRVHYFALLHAFRIRKGLAPSYLCRGFARIDGVHHHETRGSAYGFHISNSDFPGYFSYFAKVQWNALPVNLKAIERIDLFKAKLKQYLMRDY